MWRNASPPIKDAELYHDLVPQTRVHPWAIGAGTTSHPVYLKREDEGRFGITAGKQRKFASLIPHLVRSRIRNVALVGGANSNQLLAAAILLREHGMRPVPFVKRTHHEGTNQCLLRLVVPEEDWHFVDNGQWVHVEQVAGEYAQRRAAVGEPTFVLPEGACTQECLAGAMTLAADVARNLQGIGECRSPHVFVDAGTGLTAAALNMGLWEAGIDAAVHVTLMADTEQVFLGKYRRYAEWYRAVRGVSLPDLEGRFVLHRPAFAPSFGSVNAAVLTAIQRFARQGILTDPIYSAKHLATVEQALEAMAQPCQPAIVIHSGGAQALPGYAALFR